MRQVVAWLCQARFFVEFILIVLLHFLLYNINVFTKPILAKQVIIGTFIVKQISVNKNVTFETCPKICIHFENHFDQVNNVT